MQKEHFLPTSKKEVDRLGWDYIDIILFSGDAYIDHPSFGTAVIGRYLEHLGYRVAIVPQPNWQDDLRDFKKLGAPRLFFGVTSGVMDSMVNHYTAAKRKRSNDAYTPNGTAGQRPDRATTVYSNILKNLYPDIPVIIGGVEASLRRLSHYDWWDDKILPSILFDSKADILVYGMGERSIGEIAAKLSKGDSLDSLKEVSQIAYLSNTPYSGKERSVVLSSFEECLKDSSLFTANFAQIEKESNVWSPAYISEQAFGKYVIVNPPFSHKEIEIEIDSYYDLPYNRKPHFRYRDKRISAYEMIKDSITLHRGCFGSCSFCTISAHQGKFVQSRSRDSILKEAKQIAISPDFKGTISDLGGPSANMYGMEGIDLELCKKCKRFSCIFPSVCKNLDSSHSKLLNIYSEVGKIDKIKRAFVSSGIRYDLFLNEKGFFNREAKEYFRELVKKHTSGRLKVAPEHSETDVLKVMRKPNFSQFSQLKKEFTKVCKEENLNYQLIPYFISAHPGCSQEHMVKLRDNKELQGVIVDQVQDFTPTPMTAASVAFYSGVDPYSMRKLFVERDIKNKQRQKSIFLNKRF